MFDSDADRKSNDKTANDDCAEAVQCTCISMCERGVPEGQEDPAKALRPKIEIELEENEAQEAYIVEKECGNIVEDPPTKLEMPRLPNTKNQVDNFFCTTLVFFDSTKYKRRSILISESYFIDILHGWICYVRHKIKWHEYNLLYYNNQSEIFLVFFKLRGMHNYYRMFLNFDLCVYES